MKDFFKFCFKENRIELLKEKSIRDQIQQIQDQFKEYGIELPCHHDLDYFNLQILSRGLKNKQVIESEYEALANEMFEIWQDLDYKKRNAFSQGALAEKKEALLWFSAQECRIFIPFFDELMNTLYDKETAVLQLPQFFKLYKNFKDRMIDPFHYHHLPYEAGFVDVQFLGSRSDGFGFYCRQNHSLYVLDEKKSCTILPLSISNRVETLDPQRTWGWIEAVLNQDQRAMLQWCVGCGQLNEKIKKKCIALLAKAKR